MLPSKWHNGTQCCFSMFDCRLFISNFFLKAVCILLVSFSLIHFHKSSPTLLHGIYFLVFRMPNKCRYPETNMQHVLAYTFGFKSCSILAFLYRMLLFLLNQIWIGIYDILLNFFAIFYSYCGV